MWGRRSKNRTDGPVSTYGRQVATGLHAVDMQVRTLDSMINCIFASLSAIQFGGFIRLKRDLPADILGMPYTIINH
jgi:hypothetical protein